MAHTRRPAERGPMQHICATCQAFFYGTARKRFCSVTCRVRAHRKLHGGGMMKTSEPQAGGLAAPADRPPQHRLNDQSLKALLAASDAVMHGRRFTKDAAAIIHDAREERTAR